MHISDLLSEKLNSDAELLKKTRLAMNVFISSDLKIAYKEEFILVWFLKSLVNTKNEEEIRLLVEGLHFCAGSEIMAVLPASGIRLNAKLTISKCLTKMVKLVENIDDKLFDSVFTILKKFSLHFKSHSKQYIRVICALLNHDLSSTQYTSILSLTLNIFRSGSFHEKFVMHLLKEGFHSLFGNLDDSSEKADALLNFIHKMIFSKEILSDFQKMLHSVCSKEEVTVQNPLINMLFSSLHSTYLSDFNDNVKTQVFSNIFKAFGKSCSEKSDFAILQFFIVLCHVIGLEQLVLLKPENSDNLPENVVNKTYFEATFLVTSSPPSNTSYVVVKQLIESLSERYPDLSLTLSDSTYLRWFQLFASATANVAQLSSAHFDFFTACSELNTSIIEKNFAKIFSRILSQSDDCSRFMENMLRMYSKVQRIEKFVKKLLNGVKNTESGLALKSILSDGFIDEFSNTVTLLSSTQSLAFMDDLMAVLDQDCVTVLEENSRTVNTLLIKVACTLLTAFLGGVRVMNHTTPKELLKLFVEKQEKLKTILGRFGRALLVRIHDRGIVQPFLSLSFYWGEIELLIMYYAEENSESLVNKASSPVDLSTLHSYLGGEEWNVLAERVSNFGAAHCYQLFLKLILQKLRTLHLKNCYSLISGEATSKYILIQLTSELYNHNIVEELLPDDFGVVLSHLTHKQRTLLLDKLYGELFQLDRGKKLVNWISGSALLENRNFVLLSLVVIFRKISLELAGDEYNCLAMDFIDESNEINQKNMIRFMDELNAKLINCEPAVVEDATKFGLCIEVLKLLPLSHMGMEVSLLCVTGFILLSVAFSKKEELLKPLLEMLYTPPMKVILMDPNSSLDKGRCVRWLLQISWKSVTYLRNALIKLLLKRITRTETGMEELKKLVRFIKKQKQENGTKSLEQQILLYHDLGTSWGKSKKREAENDMISSFRSKLLKRIRSELERQNELKTQTVDSEVLVRAYELELMRAIRSKDQKNLAGVIGLNFDKFVDIAVSKVVNGSKGDGYVAFLSTVLLHMPRMREHIRKNTLTRIWKGLRSCEKVDRKLFYATATDGEFQFFMIDLVKSWKGLCKNGCDGMSLETYFTTWKELLKEGSGSKEKIYMKYLNRFFVQLSLSTSYVNNFPPSQVNSLFNFLQFCITSSSVTLTSVTLDIFFDVIYSYNYRESFSVKEFQIVFESSISAVSWLFATRWFRTKDKIHNVFQLFGKLLDSLSRRSCVDLSLLDVDLLVLSSCSYNMEKWTMKIINERRDFSRLAVYFIGEIVSSFVKITIYPVVKNYLVNCINHFLKISDSHDIAYLMRVLSPGSQQVFSGIYETYMKYYKFKGKI